MHLRPFLAASLVLSWSLSASAQTWSGTVRDIRSLEPVGEARVCAVLLVWFLGTVAAARGWRGGIWIYYLDAAYPAPFVFLGIFLAAVWGDGGCVKGEKGEKGVKGG